MPTPSSAVMRHSRASLLTHLSLLVAVISPAGANQQQLDSSSATEPVEVWICWDPETESPPETDGQYPHISRGVERFVRRAQVVSPLLRKNFKLIYDTTASCRKRIPTITKTCRTHGNTIMCDMGPISRASRMIGWMSALTFSYPGPKRIGEVPAPLAQYLADAESIEQIRPNLRRFWKQSDVDWSVEHVVAARDILEAWHTLARGNALPDDYFPEALPIVQQSIRIAESTLDYVFAYLLGHETYHLTNTCPLPNTLPERVDAALDELAATQVKTRALCFNPPSPKEIEADRCALGFMHQVYKLNKELDLYDDDFSKRYAVDVLSQLVLGGLSASNGTPTVRLPGGVEIKNHNTPDGYLFTPIRVLAVSELIRTINESASWEVGLCDTAGLDTFRALTGAAHCPEEVPFVYASSDWLVAFSDYFPERGMNALMRTPRPVLDDEEDFACGPEDMRKPPPANRQLEPFPSQRGGRRFEPGLVLQTNASTPPSI